MHAIKLSFIFSVRRRRPTHSTLLTGRTAGVLVFGYGFAPRGRRAEIPETGALSAVLHSHVP